MNEDKRWEEAADRVTEGSDTAPSTREERELAQAAAAAIRAMVRPECPPTKLRERLRQDAAAFAAEGLAKAPVRSRIPQVRLGRLIFDWFPVRATGWQAVAAFALAVAVWVTWQGGPSMGRIRSLAVLRESWLRETADVATAEFEPGFEKYADLSGEVEWSDSRQDGFLRLKGIPKNEPGKSQYQLWVVDPKRDLLPIDGGVFDVASGSGETVVHFQPRLPVSKPKAFVITRERPGGVVKSQNPKPVAIAKL